jgi:hypothetical protein
VNAAPTGSRRIIAATCPAEVLAAAVKAEGSIEAAARLWYVPVRDVTRAVAFADEMDRRKAA